MAKLGLMALLNLDITRFENNMKKASKKTDLMSSSMRSLGGYIAGAFSIAAIGSFVKSSMQAYQQQIEAEARLQSALSDREDVMRRLAEDAGKLQNTSLFADDDIINAQAMFATMGLGEDAIRSLLPLVADFAARYGKDLPTAADMVKSAIAGSGKTLKQYGFEIDGAAGSSKRLASIMGQLNDKVKGQAEAISKLDVSAVKRFNVAWNEFLEDFGKTMSPMATAVIEYFTKSLPAAFSYIMNGFKTLKNEREKYQSDDQKELAKYIASDTDTRKALMEGYIARRDEALKLYKIAKERNLEGMRERWSTEYATMNAVIDGANKYNQEQKDSIKIDQEAIDAANKLAEARLKASQANDRDFITSVGYIDRMPKADFGKGITNDAIISQLDNTLGTLRQVPVIQEKITLSTEKLSESLMQAEPSFQRFIVNLKTWKDKSEEIVKKMNEMLNAGIADMIGVISEGLGNAIIENSFESFWLTIIESMANFMQAFGKALISYAIAMEAFKTTFANPYAAIAAGAALIATGAIIKGLIAKQQEGLKGMADGGIVTGPTPVLVGEYPGARSNPEVIAPLDKLSALIGGGNTVNVQGRLMGADILISSERYSKQRTRVRGF